ncbi:MAG: type II/IV secretion system protein [Candidatus Omnitrophota bacterium]|nr:MAG: type II/IV secretion system protein [Candidatus Omnitrophota bacterium]
MSEDDIHKKEKDTPKDTPDVGKIEDEQKNIILASDSYAAKFVQRTILDAVERRASDIFIEPSDENLRIRYRIDGLLYEMGTCPLKHASPIVSCCKVMSNLDIAEHRFPQDGRFRFHVRSNPVDFRVSVLATNMGERVVMRVLDKSRVELNLDRLGFDGDSLQIIRRNLKKPYGMILVCGPTGCGKTTTLYACLRYIDSIDVNITTVEDPIEFQLPGINQVAVNEEIGLTFASVLRSTLRQDPDIIMVGEIRDFETADIAVKASLTGHLVLSTLHTTTATGAVVRFINMGIEPFLIASSCLVTASQSLLRRFCSKCKEEVEPPETLREALKNSSLSVSEHLKYYQSQGCRFCNNTGHSGREGIIEVLELDSEIRDLLINKESEGRLREVAVRKGMRTLREKALMKVIEGITTIEEVYRVTL